MKLNIYTYIKHLTIDFLNYVLNFSRYADYGTMLKIEDWVLLGDGCSILTTVGMQRFHVLSRGEKDGYDTAQVQFLSDKPIKEENLKGISLHLYS